MATRVINTNVWKDSFIVDLDTDEKLLWLYLLSNHMTNIAGIYELSVREMAFDTDIDKKRIEAILQKFEKAGKIRYVNGWVALNNWIKHQATNPKVAIGINRIIDNLPEWLKKELLDPDDPQASLLEHSVSKSIDSLSKPIALNLTKLNLTKLNGNVPAGGSKEPSEKQKKRNYALASEADREQEKRARRSFTRKASEPIKASDADPYALREGRKP